MADRRRSDVPAGSLEAARRNLAALAGFEGRSDGLALVPGQSAAELAELRAQRARQIDQDC